MPHLSIRRLLIPAFACASLFVATFVATTSSFGQAAPAGQAQPLPTPRLPDGTVNFGRIPGEKGAWNVAILQNMARYATNRPVAPSGGPNGGSYVDGSGGAAAEPWIPFQPWSAAVYNYNTSNAGKYDPEGYCMPPGGPRFFTTPYPMEIVQQPEHQRILMIFEGGAHVWREIYMDGRPHPRQDSIKGETWLGHSVGHWEGDALVVDIANFNEGTWLDIAGHPHTNLLHVVERFTRPNKNTLHYEATFDDPGAYTKPWTAVWDIAWTPNAELQEYICQENNSYLNHLKDDFDQPVIQ